MKKNKKTTAGILILSCVMLTLSGCAGKNTTDNVTNVTADVLKSQETTDTADEIIAKGGSPEAELPVENLDIMDPDVTGEYEIPRLKDSVTADMGQDFIMGTEATGGDIKYKDLVSTVDTHFNALTLGNELKPDSMFGYSYNACPGTEEVTLNGDKIMVPVMKYNGAETYLDKILQHNEENPDDIIRVRGHVLVWHSQTPEWFFHEDYDADKPYVSAEEMDKRQEWYISSVLTHFTGDDSKYKDLFYGWDVVNEAISDGSGTYRNDKEGSSWWAVYGSNEFIISAFRYANKYAPANLKLYYNDYNECTSSKMKGIRTLLEEVKAAEGTRIDGMGMQGHYDMNYPSESTFKTAAKNYAEVVDEVMITELDLKASTSYDGTADTLYKEYIKQAGKYRDIYDWVKELKEEGVNFTGIVFWGVTDKYSWLQAYTGVGGGVTDGRPQCPLLFDDRYRPKPAFFAFADQDRLKELIEIYEQNGGEY